MGTSHPSFGVPSLTPSFIWFIQKAILQSEHVWSILKGTIVVFAQTHLQNDITSADCTIGIVIKIIKNDIKNEYS